MTGESKGESKSSPISAICVTDREVRSSFVAHSQRLTLARASQRLGKEAYTVGIVCPLAIDLAAVLLVLDKVHKVPEDFKAPSSDTNQYTFGSLGQHNVVVVGLPSGSSGQLSVTLVVTTLHGSFPKLRNVALVEIGSGLPDPAPAAGAARTPRRGDVVVSEYVASPDLAALRRGERKQLWHLAPAGLWWRGGVTHLQAKQGTILKRHRNFLNNCEFAVPGESSDPHDSWSAEAVSQELEGRSQDELRYSVGAIASMTEPVEDEKDRNLLQRSGFDCVDGSSAGLAIVDGVRYLVVCGVCNHPAKPGWSRFAAAQAASYLFWLLYFMGDLAHDAAAPPPKESDAAEKPDKASSCCVIS